MKRIVLIAAVLLIIVLPVMSWAADEAIQRVFDQIGKSEKTSVGKIWVGDYYGPRALGSGFVVDANGIIATNDHVIRDNNVGGITIGNNFYWFKKIIYSNEQYDFALMQVDVRKPLSPLKLGNSNNEGIGNKVYVISSPGRLENVLAKGQITGDIVKMRGGIYFPISATVDHGSSGAPVFNVKAEVIGIIAMGREDIQIANQNWAIPINIIKDKIPSKISIDENSNKVSILVVFLIMKQGDAFQWRNYFINDEGTRVCTYRYGGIFCFRKDDVALITKSNEDVK